MVSKFDGVDEAAEAERANSGVRSSGDARRVFEAFPAPLLILLPDTYFTVAAASDAYLSKVHARRSDVVGKPVSAVYPHNAASSGTEDSETLRAALSLLVRCNGLSPDSSQRVHVAGHESEPSRVWRTSQKAVLTSDGRIMCILHWMEDMTGVPQVDGQDLIRDCAQSYKLIADTLPQAVWTARPDGYTDYYNARFFELTGAPPEAAQDGLWANFLHPDDVERAKQAWRDSVAAGTPHESTFRVRDRSGAYRWTLSRAIPVRHGAQILKWIGTNTDVNEKVLAEIELREAHRRKDEFLAMLAHELRNPLVPINAGAEMLARVGSNDARIAQVGDMIRRQVAHVSTLIDDLLEASRVNQNRISLESRTVDMKRVVEDSSEQIRPLLEAHKHRLGIHLPPEPVCVCGDHNRLVQVFVNLLTNSVKYTPDGGDIWLAAERSNGEVVVSVKDNGVGMEPELLVRAFEIFEQGARSSARTEGGLGLGLAMVKGLVELQHGTVTAKSEGQGKGSEVTVRLPLIQGKTVDKLPTASAPEPTLDGGRHHILLVEDNVDVADSVGMVLEILGHEVSIEHEPHGAIERAKHESFDRCILDIGLPNMDGYELARELRSLPGTQHAVFIAHTGYGQTEDIRLSTEAGFAHHLVKPAAIPEIERVLANETTP